MAGWDDPMREFERLRVENAGLRAEVARLRAGTPRPRGRFQWDDDGAHLDEIVLTGVTFHIERMSQHGWWLGVDCRETGERLSMWWQQTAEPVLEDDFTNVDRDIRGPLLYHGGPWSDRKGGEHRCELHGEHRRCRCECGARQANPDSREERS